MYIYIHSHDKKIQNPPFSPNCGPNTKILDRIAYFRFEVQRQRRKAPEAFVNGHGSKYGCSMAKMHRMP